MLSNDSSNSDIKTFDNSKVYSFPCIASSSSTQSLQVCMPLTNDKGQVLNCWKDDKGNINCNPSTYGLNLENIQGLIMVILSIVMLLDIRINTLEN